MPRRSLLAAAATTAAALVAGSLAALSAGPAAEAAPARVSGIDIASWQHPGGKPIDWAAVARAGHRFAIIKATESTTYTNPYFAADRAGARSVGMVVGAYHFARPAKPVTRTATAQARYFVKVVGTERLAKTLPPVLDLESTGGLSKAQLATWSRTWLATVRSLTGRTPMLYSYDSFLRNSLGSATDFRGYPLWYANYTSRPPSSLPGSWGSWRIWQHTSTGKVPGISGSVDLNWFDGSYGDLLRFATGRVPAGVGQTTVQRGESTYITGRVDRAYAGEPISRTVRTATGTWQHKKAARVRADGSYVFWVTPTARRTYQYRIHLRSGSPYANVRSATTRVRVVKPSVRASLARTRTASGNRVRISGRVDSFYAGDRVVKRERLADGRWVRRDVHRVRADGSFAFWVRPSAVGTHRYTVRLRATRPVADATSRVLHLKVRGRR